MVSIYIQLLTLSSAWTINNVLESSRESESLEVWHRGHSQSQEEGTGIYYAIHRFVLGTGLQVLCRQDDYFSQ